MHRSTTYTNPGTSAGHSARRDASSSLCSRSRFCTAGQSTVPGSAEGCVEQSRLLSRVERRVALARARPRGAAGVAELDPGGKGRFEEVADRVPGAHVLRLFLYPDELHQARVAGERLPKLGERERVGLLDADDRDVVMSLLPSALDQVVVHAARAGDHGARERRRRLGVAEHELERSGRQLVECRGGRRGAKESLGCEHDERARDVFEGLAAEQVEVLRRGGRVGDPQVVLGGQLQEAFDPCARVLRPVALVAVREEQRQPRALTPLGVTGGDELVDDDLGPLAKSPNCASHRTSASGVATA
jgi:hypothetical protein